eukprot:g30964.t1
MFSGTLRIFLLPSHDEQVSTHLKVLLPPQSPVIVRCTGLVASRRALYVVNLRHGDILQEVPLLFAARPCIIAEGQSVFVQCDEAIRVWKCSALLQCQADTTEPLAMPQEFELNLYIAPVQVLFAALFSWAENYAMEHAAGEHV